MRFLILALAPFLAFGQIVVHPISSYPDTAAPYDSMQFVAQQKPNSPVVYKKIYGVQFRNWVGAQFDSAGCAGYIDCDSTGTGKVMRAISPTTSGVFTMTGRDTTAGRIASHGSIKSDSNLTSATMNLTGGGANNGYLCYNAPTHLVFVSDTSCPHP